jgi:hypothetical protein
VAFQQAHPLFYSLLDVRRAGERYGDLVKEFDLFIGKGERAGLALRIVGNIDLVHHAASH